MHKDARHVSERESTGNKIHFTGRARGRPGKSTLLTEPVYSKGIAQAHHGQWKPGTAAKLNFYRLSRHCSLRKTIEQLQQRYALLHEVL